MVKINSARYEIDYPVYGARFLNESTLLVTGGGQVGSSQAQESFSSNNNRLTALIINLEKKKKPIKKFRELKLKDEDDVPTTLDAKKNLILLGANEGSASLAEGHNHNLHKFFFHNEHLKYVTSISLEIPQLNNPAYLKLIKLSNDASVAAIASSKVPTVILILDPVRLMVKYEIEANNDVRDLDISPDGKALAYITNHSLEIISMVTGRSLQRRTDFKKLTLSRVRFLDDNNVLITSGIENNGGVQISNLSLDRKLKVVNEKIISKKIKGITSIDVNEKNGVIAVSGNEGSVIILNIASLKVLKIFNNVHTLSITEVTFSPEGRFLASVSAAKTIEVIEIPEKWGIETHKMYFFFLRSFQILILAIILQLGWMYYSSRQSAEVTEVVDYFQMKPRVLSPSDTASVIPTPNSNLVTSSFSVSSSSISSFQTQNTEHKDSYQRIVEKYEEKTEEEYASEDVSIELTSIESTAGDISGSSSNTEQTAIPTTSSIKSSSSSTASSTVFPILGSPKISESITTKNTIFESTPSAVETETIPSKEELLKKEIEINQKSEADQFKNSTSLENKTASVIEPAISARSSSTIGSPAPIASVNEEVTTTTSIKKKKKKTKKRRTRMQKTRKAGQSATLSSGSEPETASESEGISISVSQTPLTFGLTSTLSASSAASATSSRLIESTSSGSFTTASNDTTASRSFTTSSSSSLSPSKTIKPLVSANNQAAVVESVSTEKRNESKKIKEEAASEATTHATGSLPLTSLSVVEDIVEITKTIADGKSTAEAHVEVTETTLDISEEPVAFMKSVQETNLHGLKSRAPSVTGPETKTETETETESEVEEESDIEEIPETEELIGSESESEFASALELKVTETSTNQETNSPSLPVSVTAKEPSIAAIVDTATPETAVEQSFAASRTPEYSTDENTPGVEDIFPEETQIEDDYTSPTLENDVDEGYEADDEESFGKNESILAEESEELLTETSSTSPSETLGEVGATETETEIQPEEGDIVDEEEQHETSEEESSHTATNSEFDDIDEEEDEEEQHETSEEESSHTATNSEFDDIDEEEDEEEQHETSEEESSHTATNSEFDDIDEEEVEEEVEEESEESAEESEEKKELEHTANVNAHDEL